MLNEKNLIPFSERTESEQREIRKKGGIKSGETRRRKRDMKSCLDELFQREIPDTLKIPLEKSGMEYVEDANYCETLVYTLMNKAIKGDTRAAALIMDIAGARQSDKTKQEELKLKKKEFKLREDAISKENDATLDKLDAVLGEIKSAF